MASLVAVVNESIGVAESLTTTLEDLSALNAKWSPEHPPYPSAVDLVPLDIPTLTDDCCSDPYWLAAVIATNGAGTWSGGFIEVSYDGGVTWVKRAEYDEETATGFVVPDAPGDRALGDPLPDLWDSHTRVTVEMQQGHTLKTRTRAEVLEGANLLFIDGEIRAFATATEISAPFDTPPFGGGITYVLTDWIRGMRGTQVSSLDTSSTQGRANLHMVVDLGSSLVQVPLPVGDDDLALRYRARDRDDEEGAEGVAIALTGANLKPFKVTGITVARDTGSNITITWVPVTREPCTQILSARGVKDDDPTTYDVQILDGPGGAVKRTFQVTTEFTPYIASHQTDDFGSTQSLIYFTITRTGTWMNGDAVEEQG